jgi:transcriptional regulator with XRE-family HTH domain
MRTYHQLKQVQLAERLNISSSYLSEIENGNKQPSLEILQGYSRIFSLPVSSILLFSEQILDGDRTALRTKIRVASADKILKILEWLDEQDNLKI